MKKFISRVYNELVVDGINIGEAWINRAVDFVLADGIIFENRTLTSRSKHS
jgi:hypothetical protein